MVENIKEVGKEKKVVKEKVIINSPILEEIGDEELYFQGGVVMLEEEANGLNFIIDGERI